MVDSWFNGQPVGCFTMRLGCSMEHLVSMEHFVRQAAVAHKPSAQAPRTSADVSRGNAGVNPSLCKVTNRPSLYGMVNRAERCGSAVTVTRYVARPVPFGRAP